MKKNKAKDGIVVNAGNDNYIPNIVRGGAAIPIGKKNFYYMQGRKHEQGGIDVGRNPKTGLEVEGEEVMQVTPNEVRVYSSVPFLRGVSPAELVLNGVDANKVFAAQEKYKDNNRINDDGTKYRIGGEKDNNTLNSPYEDPTFTINRKPIDLRKDAGKATNLNINKKVFNTISKLTKFTKVFSPVGEFIQHINPTKEKEYLYESDKYSRDILKNNIDKNYFFKFGDNTNNKSKMGKLVSINGNVKNGLIHTPNQDVLAADLLLPKGKVNIEPDVPKRLGFVCGGRSKAKTGTKKDNVIDEIVINAARPKLSAYSVLKDNDTSNRHSKKVIEREVYQADALSSDRLKTKIDNTPYKEKEIDTSYGDRIVTPLINSKSVTKAERNTNIRGRINNEYDSVEELLNRVRKLGTDAQDKSNKDYIPYSSPVDNYGEKTFRNNITLDRLNRFGITPHTYGNGERTISNTSINDNQDIIESINNETPRKGTNQSSSSSTGDVNNRTSKSAKPTIQRVNRLAPATNAEMAGIRRGLEPLLQNTIVNKLNKTVDNDLNVMPAQTDVTKTRNMDNILLGVNLGSSVLDAVMGNIYANQMHGYAAPNITAPTIKNPGEIKLNEEDLKDIPAPILMAAAKLKTRYNANPQLSKIEDETRRIMGEIDRNTSNSRVALARKQRAALQGQQAKNEVYGRKENIETELINKDKLNQQEVTARNLARYDQYNQALAAQRANRARLRFAADTANIQNKLAVSTANAQLKSQADRFNATNRINQLVHQAGIDAAKAEARSNIFSGMLGNIGSALNTWNRNKRQAKLDEETLRVLGLRAPNANKLVLSALGY